MPNKIFYKMFCLNIQRKKDLFKHFLPCFLLLLKIECIVNMSPSKHEIDIQQSGLKGVEEIDQELLYIKNEDLRKPLDLFGVTTFDDIKFDLSVCLRLYKFRTEVTFNEDYEDTSSIAARLIGPLYRSAYNGDLSCVSTLVNEFQGSDILKGNLNIRCVLAYRCLILIFNLAKLLTILPLIFRLHK